MKTIDVLDPRAIGDTQRCRLMAYGLLATGTRATPQKCPKIHVVTGEELRFALSSVSSPASTSHRLACHRAGPQASPQSACRTLGGLSAFISAGAFEANHIWPLEFQYPSHFRNSLAPHAHRQEARKSDGGVPLLSSAEMRDSSLLQGDSGKPCRDSRGRRFQKGEESGSTSRVPRCKQSIPE